jgi:hypothetical protein
VPHGQHAKSPIEASRRHPPPSIPPMSFLIAEAMVGGSFRRRQLMCRFEMALVAISSGTWLQVLINSCSTIFTMEGKGSIVMSLLSDSSTTPTLAASKAVQTLTKPLQTSSSLVSSTLCWLSSISSQSSCPESEES